MILLLKYVYRLEFCRFYRNPIIHYGRAINDNNNKNVKHVDIQGNQAVELNVEDDREEKDFLMISSGTVLYSTPVIKLLSSLTF
jgi:hypothetical protein